MQDRKPNIFLSVETNEALIVSQALDLPFGVSHSLVRKTEIGYQTDSSFTVLPGDSNNPDEAVVIKKT